MARQTGLDLIVLVFVPPGTAPEGVTTLAARLDESPRFARASVTWSMPGLGVLEDATVRETVAARRTSAGDAVATAGYAGVSHSVLLARELEPECALGLTNPGGSGLLDVFADAGRVLLAPFPDPRRPEAAAVYARHFDVFARGVVPAAGREPACILFAVGGHTWSLPVVICGAGATEASVSADIRTLEKQRHRDAAVIVQAGADGALEALEAALDRQSGAAQEPAIRPFDPEWITSVGEPTTATPAATETGACRLACVRTSDAVNDLRAESSDRPELVLRRIAEERATATYEAPCDGNPPPGRVIHASMMGTATLQMDGCEVQFSRGRLSRFAGVPRERRAQLLADTVSGSVRTADGTLELSPETAFSFEESGAGVRGLMSILSLGRDEFHAPGRLLVDYSAVGDFPWLFVDLCFEFPVLSDGATVEELVPFVLPLRMPDRTEDLILTTQYPDGSGSRIDLHGVTGAGCAFGSLLQVGSRFTISWAEPRPGVTGAFRFEVRRGLTGASMAIYPFGRFGAEDAAERAGTATRVRFAIAAGQRDYAEIVDAPPEALRRHQQSSGTR